MPPARAVRQPGLIVYGCGLVTSVLALAAVELLNKSGANVMGWYINGILPAGALLVIRFDEGGRAARIVVNHRPLGSVLLWSQLMGEHFAGTRYARYFLSRDSARALHEATESG